MQSDVRSAADPRTHAPAFAPHRPSEIGERVRKYFETSGFSRWTAIYGTGDIPPIWKIVRDGHQRVIDHVLEWTEPDRHHTALDAGCGTGNLAIQLANRGYEVDAFDVSAPMIHFAKYINSGKTKGIPPSFHVGDIGSVTAEPRSYDLVCCLDVLFHYPLEEVDRMLSSLADLSAAKLIGTFAQRTPLNDFWMRVGQRLHAKNRMTKLFMFSQSEIDAVLKRAGFKVVRTKRIKYFFYDSTVFEAVRTA
ncbi:magnesium protoporphyrin IX methyltransferase [Vulcanimicrobium alpinum]|uniref:Magnesium protoporphyrin IX methyltransferase n=1 Tax=Vulcanimicrobium alpinum TaxID=3016050 RepID=A0AAN1XXK7_UNVUL|nr:magnesium protoporphyrin IX methyltransferase [Vulcanimicrobium alpinum]BDE07219.1 magnesium protoporphyrin IX methyltransferase [Vulcanimicrobium alpinum]